MLTGSATTADIDAAHAAGINAMLRKPFGLAPLRAQVDKLLAGSSDGYNDPQPS